jgi:hypothetical protein
MAPRRAGLLDGDAVQLRQSGLHLLPDPDCNQLRRGILQAWDFIEEIVVQLFDDRVDCALEIGKVHDPPRMGVDFAAYSDLPAERVAVHSPALVAVGHVRQEVSGLETEVLDELDWMHDGSLIRPALEHLFAWLVIVLLCEVSS